MGYNALLRKKSGKVIAWPIPMNLSLVFMKDAMKMDIAAKPPEAKNIIRQAEIKKKTLGTKLTPMIRATGMIIRSFLK